MAKITLEARGEEHIFDCNDGDTISRAALRAQLGFPYACNVGSCGNCRFELLEGSVTHARENPPAWSERDLKRNRYLGCQAQPQGDCRIKLRLDPSYLTDTPPKTLQGTLLEVVELTHDIFEFRYQLNEPHAFLPGQYALISVPGVPGGRAYSMCNLTGDGTQWHFQIKKVPNGAATSVLFTQQDLGMTVQLDGPYGTAYVRPESPRDILCLAGGSGLSPMISIARAKAHDPRLQDRKLTFVFGGRTGRDICGEDILQELPGYGTLIDFHAAISNPDEDDGSWTGPTGYIHELARTVLGDAEIAQREIYFAGPPAMAQAIQKLLHELQVPPEQVHFDEFY